VAASPQGDPAFQAGWRKRNFAGATFYGSVAPRRMRPYAVALAEGLLSAPPIMGRARGCSPTIAPKAYAPDDDEGKMIEIVSRPKIAAIRTCSGNRVGKPHEREINLRQRRYEPQ